MTNYSNISIPLSEMTYENSNAPSSFEDQLFSLGQKKIDSYEMEQNRMDQMNKVKLRHLTEKKRKSTLNSNNYKTLSNKSRKSGTSNY